MPCSVSTLSSKAIEARLAHAVSPAAVDVLVATESQALLVTMALQAQWALLDPWDHEAATAKMDAQEVPVSTELQELMVQTARPVLPVSVAPVVTPAVPALAVDQADLAFAVAPASEDKKAPMARTDKTVLTD